MPKIKVSISVGLAEGRREDIITVDDEEWDACKTDEERDDLMHAYWRDWADSYIDGGFELIE